MHLSIDFLSKTLDREYPLDAHKFVQQQRKWRYSFFGIGRLQLGHVGSKDVTTATAAASDMESMLSHRNRFRISVERRSSSRCREFDHRSRPRIIPYLLTFLLAIKRELLLLWYVSYVAYGRVQPMMSHIISAKLAGNQTAARNTRKRKFFRAYTHTNRKRTKRLQKVASYLLHIAPGRSVSYIIPSVQLPLLHSLCPGNAEYLTF